ncbi:hypothetical protein [uncultured Kordia sp.]|uniref:hypothetical protein n=1 Tax=uncultured Kordia sp. TaxID=507699 RepID=UPI00261388B6|nr:hypothetical protein [uncultured Kordia sp.]
MEIIWTKLAKITYIEILENLNNRWTKKEIRSFTNLTNELLKNIQENKIMHPFVHNDLGIQKSIIHKNVSLFYKKDTVANKIYLITFFNNRMSPEVLKRLLNT